MKLLALFFMLALMLSAPVAEAQWSNSPNQELSPKEKRKREKQEAKQARQVAQQHYKEYIVQKRKALILVKKIEDERSRNASIRSFKLLYDEEEVQDSDVPRGNGRVIGNVGSNRSSSSNVSDEAKNKAMEAERKKFERQIKKIDDQLAAESTRIEEAELMTDELQNYIKKALE